MVRWLLNDGVVPLEHIEGCEGGREGECALDVFVRKTIEFTSGIDWAYDCCECSLSSSYFCCFFLPLFLGDGAEGVVFVSRN